MRRFLLDDLRVMPDMDVVARTPVEAFVALDNDKAFNVYVFDHDLGEVKPGTTGYDVLKWALENDKLNEKASIYFCTSNPVGRANMEGQLLTHGWFRKGQEWVKQ